MIRKRIELKIKDIATETREVAFYFNKFGDYDADNDRIMPGAGAKTRMENFERIKHLYNHKITIGKPMSIQEDNYGDFMVSKIGRDTVSNDVYLKYQDGLITEHSFGFELVKDKYKPNEKGGFDIFEYKLWEASSLDLWGAQSQTPVMSIKSLDQITVSDIITRLELLNKALSNGYTDETAKVIETEIKELTEILKKSTQPAKTTEPQFDGNKFIVELINNL